MADTGFGSPQSVVNVDRSGGVDWINVTNADTQNDSYAYGSPLFDGDEMDWLRATRFGFSVPAGATINGIEVEIDRKSDTANGIIDSAIYLRKTAGQAGDNKSVGAIWDTTDDDAYNSFGGAADLWGTTWTQSEINSPNFGVDISPENSNAFFPICYIDHVQIKVTYTEGGAPPSATYSGRAIGKGIARGIMG